MNVLNHQSPANGNGHPAFPAARGPRPSSHHQRYQDGCQHLLPVALPSPPASNTLRSFQPSRSTRTPLIGANRGGSPPREEPLHRANGAANVPAFNTQGRQMSNAILGFMEDICKLSHLLDGGGCGGEDHLNFPADPTTEHRHVSQHVVEEGERKANISAAGDVEFEPCSTALGIVRSLMEDDKFSLVQKDYAVGDHLDQQLFPPEEPPPSVVTLAVSVSSAVKLETKQMDQIAKKMRRLTGFKNLRMENTVDPSLIAGIVISYGIDEAHVIDLSVKSRLAELEARLESSDQSAGAEAWNFPQQW